MSNRLLNNHGPTVIRNKRYIRFPIALLISGFVSFGLNKVLLKSLLYNDLKEEKLDKYYELDLNADMMK